MIEVWKLWQVGLDHQAARRPVMRTSGKAGRCEHKEAFMAHPSPDASFREHAAFEALAQQHSDAPRPVPVTYGPEDFPGCESFHLPASEIDHYEGRLEFWDGYTETAWKVESTPIQHEVPSRRLVEMATRVASVRGSRIGYLGSADLVRLDAKGRKRWLMQADELLYLRADRMRLHGSSALDVDEDPLPDVVLEVDHTTDVRRRKLGIYKECGFPEIWVLVPWASSVRTLGLTIHVRRDGGYRTEASSRAFPGWKVEEIHRVLTEEPPSEEAWRALERVALAMGAREGTSPEDDPLMRSVSLRSESRGHAKGHAQGRMEAVVATLRARGIEVSPDFAGEQDPFAEHPIERLMAAALACTDEADFRRRVREAAG